MSQSLILALSLHCLPLGLWSPLFSHSGRMEVETWVQGHGVVTLMSMLCYLVWCTCLEPVSHACVWELYHHSSCSEIHDLIGGSTSWDRQEYP